MPVVIWKINRNAVWLVFEGLGFLLVFCLFVFPCVPVCSNSFAMAR